MMWLARDVLGVLWMALQLLRSVTTQASVIDRSGTLRIYKRLHESETTIMDLGQFSTQIRVLRISQYNQTSAPEEAIKAAKNWVMVPSMKYSDLDKECIVDTQGQSRDRLFDRVGWDANGLMQSRYIKPISGSVYISTSYLETLNNLDPVLRMNRRRNLLETLRIPYNATAFGNVTEEIAVDQPVVGPYDVCMENQYILEYRQMIYLCAELVPLLEKTGYLYNHSIYFHRTGAPRVYLFSLVTYSYNRTNPENTTVYPPLSLDKKLGMVVAATNEQKLEVIAYVVSSTNMAIFTIDAVFTSTPAIYTLKNSVLTLNYIANSLMILTNSNIQSFYLERYPGSSFLPETFHYIAAARFLKSSFSNEDTEIALELIYYRNFAVSQANKLEVGSTKFVWGQLPPVIHSMFTYNLLTKQLRQVSQQIVAISLSASMTGNLIQVYSFPCLDGLALNYAARIFYRQNATELRVGLVASIDAFTGFSASNSYNATYNFYLTHAADELLRHATLLTPYRSAFTVGNRTSRCLLLLQRLQSHALRVAQAPAAQAPLTLDLYDFIYNRTVFTYHFEFLNATAFHQSKLQLWKGSDLDTYLMRPSYVGNQRLPLEQLVRGSFILLHNERQTESRFNYKVANLSRVSEVVGDSVFDMRSVRVRGQMHLNSGQVKSLVAIERVFEGRKSETILFLQGTLFPEIAIYSVVGSELVFKNFHQSIYTIKRTFMVSENYYLMLHADGSLFGFNPLTYQLTVLNYPGSECLDMTEMYHPKLKPALICLNRELQLVLYLVDQLVSKSFMNTRLTVRLEGPAGDLRASSQLYSSEFYPGRLFVLNPAARFLEPNLATYFLEVEEFPVVRRQAQNSLPLPSFHDHLSAKVFSLLFAHDHLVVHFTAGSGRHWIGVYTMESDGTAREYKLYALPESLEVEAGTGMRLFYRHTQSILFVNKDKPLVVLGCRLREAVPLRNALVIDPFAPLLETVPVMLLPKHSATAHLLVFPYLVSSLRKQRVWSVGLLHYAFGQELQDQGYSNDSSHLVQFVDSNELSVKLVEQGDSASAKPLQAIFHGNTKETSTERQFRFRSQLDLGQKVFERSIKIEYLSFTKGVPRERVQRLQNRTISVGEQMVRASSGQEGRPGPITVFAMRFAWFFNASSVLEMRLEPEGLYDWLLENIVLVRPLEPLAAGLRVGPTAGLSKLERFCRKYRLADEGRRAECHRYGLVLFYPRHVQVFYEDSLALLREDQGVRFEFNDAICTENTVVNHTLLSVCMEGTVRTARVLDLIDLTINTVESSVLNLMAIYPGISFPKTVRGFPETIVQYSKSLVDVRNQKALSNTYYGMVYFHLDKQKTQRPLLNDLVPRIDFFNGFDASITDTSLGAAYFPFKPVKEYRMLNAVLASGNLVTLRLNVYANLSYFMGDYDLTNPNRQNETASGPNDRVFYFSTNSVKAIKNIIFAGGMLQNLLVTRSDHVVLESQSPRFHTLLVFPNYHSFLFSYTDFQREQVSIFRLYNPFSELLNQYPDRPATCYRWACLLVSLFDGQYYLRVYDMSFDTFGLADPNFLKNFPQASSAFDEQDKVDNFFDFEHIKEEYTLYPIIVKQFADLEFVDFHRMDELEGPDLAQLTLLVFQRPDRLSLFSVSRELRITVQNIYFSSRSLSLVLSLPFASQAHTLFSFAPFAEPDSSKYLLHLLAVVLLGAALTALIRRWILAESAARLHLLADRPALPSAEATPLLPVPTN